MQRHSRGRAASLILLHTSPLHHSNDGQDHMEDHTARPRAPACLVAPADLDRRRRMRERAVEDDGGAGRVKRDQDDRNGPEQRAEPGRHERRGTIAAGSAAHLGLPPDPNGGWGRIRLGQQMFVTREDPPRLLAPRSVQCFENI